jgi:hypothetical protein
LPAGDEEAAMSDSRDPADEDLAALLDELDETLSDLRRDLRDRERPERREPTDREVDRYGYRRDRGERSSPTRSDRPTPRPPTFGEVLRFTEEYTIPTVISVLETTVQSLELLRSLLRLADPDRSAFERSGDRRGASADRLGVTAVGRGAMSGVDRALDELRTALSEGDLPEDPESRSIVAEARRLAAEIEDRIDAVERETERDRYGYRDDRGERGRRDRRSAGRARSGRRRDPVSIDVTEEGERDAESHTDGPSEDGDGHDDRPQVDVDAELASIKEEVGRRDDGGDGAGEAGDGDSADEASDGDDAQ